MSARRVQWIDYVIVAIAFAVLVLLVRREFGPRRASEAAGGMPQSLAREPLWSSLVDSARFVRRGSSGPIILQIGDFQCPFCARFVQLVHQLADYRDGRVSLALAHFPLPQHQRAGELAEYFECAWRAESGEAMHDSLFANQARLDNLDSNAASQFLPEGVRPAFLACVGSGAGRGRVSTDSLRAVAMGVRGTPTVLVDGWRFSVPPTAAQLSHVIESLRRGSDPREGLP